MPEKPTYLPCKFTYPFCYVPHPLVVEAASALMARIAADPALAAEFGKGKMLGVLVTDRGVLEAFSGTVALGRPEVCSPGPIASGQPDVSGCPSPEACSPGPFASGQPGVAGCPSPEACSPGSFASGQPGVAGCPSPEACSPGSFASGQPTAIVPGFVPPIFDLTAPDGHFRRREAEISAMPSGPGKSAASAALQDWIFDSYVVRNALGESASVHEVFARRGLVPPGGTGDCAAPKLLQFAYLHGMKPLAMGEFWYGASPAKEVREHGRFYPSCMGKCGPLLTYMMQGLDVEPNPLDAGFAVDDPEVLYADEWLLVVNKPSGMLSVPGRTAAPSLLGWLRERFGESVESCHRLDMDTSGVMVFARSVEVKAALEAQFAAREVRKTYRARLVAGSAPFGHARRGTIALPLSLDYYDRPRQMVDYEDGKKAVTEYEVLEELPNGELEVRFRPLTGRSHQIRVHAAHVRGLGRPIKGDRLYGAPDGGRLWLQAESIVFRHPVTKKEMSCDLTATTHTNHIINNTKTNNQ